MMPVQRIADEWLPVSLAPADVDLEICVMDYDGIIHSLEFPCQKHNAGWFDAATKRRIDVQPTHWRNWTGNRR